MRLPPEPDGAPLDEEFRRAVADVVPLVPRRRAPHRPLPPPLPLQSRRDERAALAESLRAPLSVDDALEAGEELAYLREGLPREVLRRLRRGHWVVQASLDLHGMTRASAAAAVAAFLRECAATEHRCVRIVHGKGLRSPRREPVLKAALRRWLVQREEVLAFCQAPASAGGAGALYVLVQRRRRRA